MCKVETLTLPGIPGKRGRPPTGKALSVAERQRNYRSRKGLKSITIQLPEELSDALDGYVKYRDTSKAAVIEKLIVTQLLRKR